MSMRRQRITLDIVYDENDSEEPSQWDFAELLDLPDAENVKVVMSEPSAPFSDDDDEA